MKRSVFAGAVVLAVSLAFSPFLTGAASAQDIEMPTAGVVEKVPEKSGIYEVGLGVGIAPEYEGSEDNRPL